MNNAAFAAPSGTESCAHDKKICMCIQGQARPVAEMPRSHTTKVKYGSASAEALPLESEPAAEADFRLSGHVALPYSEEAHLGAGAVAKHSAAAEHHGSAEKRHRPAQQEVQPVQAQPKVSKAPFSWLPALLRRQ